MPRSVSARVVLAFTAAQGTLALESAGYINPPRLSLGTAGRGGSWDQCGQTGRRVEAAPPCPPSYLPDEGPIEAGISHPIDNVASVSWTGFSYAGGSNEASQRTGERVIARQREQGVEVGQTGRLGIEEAEGRGKGEKKRRFLETDGRSEIVSAAVLQRMI
ncbi:unnamed protein product [Lota lota]